MAAVWVRARAELRSYWRSALALTVLVGLVGGVVMGAAAGARRTSSAFDRFLDASTAAHVTVLGADPALLEQIAGLPQVAVAAPAAFLMVRPVGDDTEPGLELSAAAGVDTRLFNAVDRPRIIEGRAPDPERVEEISINEKLAERRGLGVGDQMAFEWFTPDQRERLLAERAAVLLAADPEVPDLASLRLAQAVVGDHTLSVLGIEQRKGSLGYSVLQGRMPASPDEAVLGTDTLRRLRVGVGQSVEVDTDDGPARLQVVGRAAFPSVDRDLADGIGLTRAGLERLRTSGEFTNLVLNWAPGIDAEVARHRIEARVGATFAVVQPAEVANLQRVAGLPAALGGFLALLATLAVGQAVVSGLHRRRRDLAVLRTLGFVRRQVAARVAWQASILAVSSLAFGLPLGVAIGRWAWSALAGPMGVVVDQAVPLAALALLLPAALLVANVLAALPARRAARIHPAAVLRSE